MYSFVEVSFISSGCLSVSQFSERVSKSVKLLCQSVKSVKSVSQSVSQSVIIIYLSGLKATMF